MTTQMHIDPYSIRLASPLSTARGSITQRRGFLVRIAADSEPSGIGEAAPLPGWTESYDACEQALRSAASAEDPKRSVDPATTPAAAHAVESARLDRAAAAADRSAAEHLHTEVFGSAGDVAGSVPVNATIGGGSIDETVRAATEAVDSGFSCLKLKAGSDALDSDLDRVRAVREAISPTVDIRIDANGAWNRETAARAIDALAPLELEYLEQPLSADDVSGHAELRGNGVPIAVDESLASVGFAEIAEADAADVLVCKPMAIGGPRRTVALAARARAAGIDPVVTTTIDAVVARTTAVHVAAAIPDVRPCGLATASLLETDLGPDPVTVADGRVTVPSGAGIGVETTETNR